MNGVSPECIPSTYSYIKGVLLIFARYQALNYERLLSFIRILTSEKYFTEGIQVWSQKLQAYRLAACFFPQHVCAIRYSHLRK